MPEQFSRALLIEGGGAQWNVPIGARYRAGGGDRIAFLCGVASCAKGARTGQRWLSQAGVEVRTEYVAGAGHTSWGPVAERIPELFDWLVTPDSRWHANHHGS